MNQANYLAFVFYSNLAHFLDDVEFYFDDTAKVSHFRSALRLGKGDKGVNCDALEAIGKNFATP